MGRGEGTIGSLVQQIVDDLHVPIPDVVRRKCIAAMRFHKDRRYFFSDRELRFALTSGRANYRPGDGFGLPADLVEIAGPTIWILLNGSEDGRAPCNRTETSVFEVNRAAWGGQTGSQPTSWDYKTGALRFSPTPSAPTSAPDIAELRYVTDLGVPRVVYESGAYAYYHPTTGQILTSAQIDAWTNDWLTQDAGLAAIMARTTYEVQKTYLRDYEGAQDTLAQWLEMVGQLEAETESKQSAIYELEGSLGL